MGMTHAGYILYLTMVVALPLAGTIFYLLVRYGPG